MSCLAAGSPLEESAMPNKPLAAKPTAPAARRRSGAGARTSTASPKWPAGLGALAKAQQEGAKVFESLLKQGQRFEQRTREAAADTAAAARAAAAAKAREVQQIAGGTWDKLEQVFEARVARALSRLGIHTQNDIERLADRVDELAEAVNRLLRAKGAAPAKRARKKPAGSARKPARKVAAR
jgi:poly(hydroxyalkanoate) granule-associated protein